MIQVGIQTNNFFTEERWLVNLEEQNLFEVCEFKFFKSKAEFLDLINDIESVFLFDLSLDIDLKKTNIKMVYIGISDLDFLDSYDFPDSLELFFSKGFSSSLVAEYCLLSALYMIRNLEFAVKGKISHIWNQEPFLKTPARSIKDYKIGILGLGKNGLEIANTFKSIGCFVSGLSKEKKERPELDSWYSRKDLNLFLSKNDIIIISLPLRDETKNLITIDELKLIGSEGFLINVSRADIIVEEDLILALNSNNLKSAAIDVCSVESLSEGKWYRFQMNERKKSKLWSTKNLLISPHIAGNANFFVKDIQSDFAIKLRNII